MEDFIVVDAINTYNGIFGQLLLNTFSATISTYHVAVKFSARGQEIMTMGNLASLLFEGYREGGNFPRGNTIGGSREMFMAGQHEAVEEIPVTTIGDS
ncbi:hypothetical protein MA16_Dca019243 [Dendrobium catenatum]|uniref:Uncharacterized protein n=1 Tax=Dendrobium catenatum TaxID=906689 RepID=A0A2I0W3M5_9ASPA|nr:hypothetical protein MA16_Dca019243 [Dendrobium catenatum]